jgi:hypothetical protein
MSWFPMSCQARLSNSWLMVRACFCCHYNFYCLFLWFIDNINYTCTLTLFHIIMSINTILFIQPVGKIKNGQSLNIHKKTSLKMRTRTVRVECSSACLHAQWDDIKVTIAQNIFLPMPCFCAQIQIQMIR